MFYNHKTRLLVIDVVHKQEQGGNEIVRQTLDFKKLLKHVSINTNEKTQDAPDVQSGVQGHQG